MNEKHINNVPIKQESPSDILELSIRYLEFYHKIIEAKKKPIVDNKLKNVIHHKIFLSDAH